MVEVFVRVFQIRNSKRNGECAKERRETAKVDCEDKHSMPMKQDETYAE